MLLELWSGLNWTPGGFIQRFPPNPSWLPPWLFSKGLNFLAFNNALASLMDWNWIFFHIPYVFFSSFVQNYLQDSCFYHLLKDYKKNGICEGFFNPLSYNTTSCKTKLNEENILEITDGVCSRKTEKLLMQPRKCAKIHQNEPELIWRNLLFLLYYMCNTDITKKYFKIFQNPDTTLPNNPSQTARFGIFHTVREDPNWGPISLNLNFGKVSFVIYILGWGGVQGQVKGSG